ncbi:uroporphyrinogen-III synthase [Rhodococcus sp. D2-41]|uniref:Uroporphyrinogen-III synthase n=1 Tax=Speluncibacter jeojiensis TaxID=2710754 RepID=A0A9X4M0V0_9ACTN|nr:uroporphyrinogen-III synthase [Rhodococcus sp. D2-41]MDG3008739.1 uroporphyrinogen-III synthase [Rhodococcus sp. D2-41]MDG3013053.1 uroporphyrinogen-III synthase [Corynebacteriales bacterium D3-21]
MVGSAAVADRTAATDGAPGAQLAGFTVGITAARRADDFAALLTRRGAEVVQAPAIRLIPLPDDVQLRQATARVISSPPDIVVATTAIGFRGWVEAADGWGQADELLGALRSARVAARGPKVTGAVRAAGLREDFSPESESSVELLEHLLGAGVSGCRIAVQLHGAATEWEPIVDVCSALRSAGAEVIEIPVYRWLPPEDPRAVDALLRTTIDGGLDALAFTSAPAVAAMLGRADDNGLLEPYLAALRGQVLVACVGAVTAAPLTRLGVETFQPSRARLGALARELAEALPARAVQVRAGGRELSIRRNCVVVDGAVREVTPAAMALLRELVRSPGRVVSRTDMLRALPGGSADTHAVDSAVARLRASLGDGQIVQTVFKRGYRLVTEQERR